MLRLCLLAVLAISFAQGQIFSNLPVYWQPNEIEHGAAAFPYGYLGTYPFRWCHSYCTFEGEYEFMRLWENADPDFVADTQIFDWSFDGNFNFWLASVNGRNCADIIEFYRYQPPNLGIGGPSLSNLQSCRPALIYIEQIEIEYDRGGGQFHWTHHIEDAYEPTEAGWNEWAAIAHRFGTEVIGDVLLGPYDRFDGLLRYFPEYDADTRSLTNRYDDDFYYRESYIANYEPNFCSMQMPFQITDTRTWCNGIINDDTDNVDYPTHFYCDARGAWALEAGVDYRFDNCGGDDDDCDSVNFPTLLAKRRSVPEEVKELRPTKTQKLNRATRSWQQVAKRDKRDVGLRTKRQQTSSVDIFFRQDDTAGVRFPYCAIKD